MDDVTSAIYHYPVEIYGVSVFCFAVGFIYFFREKQIHTYFFIALFLSTAGFYIFSGSHIYTRTGVFLIPFLIFYQAKGVMFLTEAILYRLFQTAARDFMSRRIKETDDPVKKLAKFEDI